MIHARKAGALSAALHDHAFVQGRWRGEVLGTLFLHGRTSPVRIPLKGRWTSTSLAGMGAARFDQSSFGIKPLHKLFGAIAVRDELLLEIEVRGEASSAHSSRARCRWLLAYLPRAPV